ncbi:hypothetical protein MKW98_013564 [Papaver atlanticum]|uniref:Uncharacterized protein n=1 Tax=Papaver atlanticum TaxID=357466 RepID=A0AAD4T337_9MAGN|nr:hypothetical protein MKW98_013564 [Papaver atlanticum]
MAHNRQRDFIYALSKMQVSYEGTLFPLKFKTTSRILLRLGSPSCGHDFPVRVCREWERAWSLQYIVILGRMTSCICFTITINLNYPSLGGKNVTSGPTVTVG